MPRAHDRMCLILGHPLYSVRTSRVLQFRFFRGFVCGGFTLNAAIYSAREKYSRINYLGLRKCAHFLRKLIIRACAMSVFLSNAVS